MSTITVRTDCATTRTFASRREAGEGKRTHQSPCGEYDENDVQLTVDPAQSTLESVSDGGTVPDGLARGASSPLRAPANTPCPTKPSPTSRTASNCSTAPTTTA